MCREVAPTVVTAVTVAAWFCSATRPDVIWALFDPSTFVRSEEITARVPTSRVHEVKTS
jgi:hypothetical protein